MPDVPSTPQSGQRPQPQGELLTRGPSGVLALAAAIIAALPFYFFFRNGWSGGVTAKNPPSLFAVNLSFCAMIMGVLALYRVRQMPGQALVRAGSILAIILGMGGPIVFFAQGMNWRHSIEYGELIRAGTIAKAARAYAEAHAGQFPPGLATLVAADEKDAWHIRPEDLLSPFRPTRPVDVAAVRSASAADAEKLVLAHSDFAYLGADLPGQEKFVYQKDAGAIIAVASKQENGAAFDRRIGDNITIAFASGEPRFVPAWELAKVIEASNAARADRGLPPIDDFGHPKATLSK
jgi:hypothetical protein